MKTETLRIRICPKCGARYARTPALSREDRKERDTGKCPEADRKV